MVDPAPGEEPSAAQGQPRRSPGEEQATVGVEADPVGGDPLAFGMEEASS